MRAVVALFAVLGLAAFVACGGAAPSSLDEAPSASTVPDAGGKHPHDSGGGSSSGGGGQDATVKEKDSGHGDPLLDAADEVLADDAAEDASEAGEDAADASLCPPCTFGTVCCATRGAISYGQCYSRAICAGCCF
jgi:hypothetical protein